ncbi:LrgB family protein [Diaphorobacter aerolatus]|uniref:LrgB family protein n=1 Tax=Diaphorobacter aerolatus TaxID=1288495 RepID=A0A7H0GL67_9BURK|nr:LrgB family protein [Diaphorobacter aerolatus]QNP49033.1 LrgB family protein [Diaphorobacter aerolatus]
MNSLFPALAHAPQPFSDWHAFMLAAVLWIGVSFAAYLAAQKLYRGFGGNPLLVPVATTSLVVMLVLWSSGTSYTTYAVATRPLSWWVGPATVAIAVPLFAQLDRLKRIWRPLLIALLAGSLVAMMGAVGIAWALGGSWQTLASLMPKSATMPIAIPMAERFGGLPALAAVAVVITGVVGTVISHPLLRLLKVSDPAARGFAIGLTAHAIGMARELQINPVSGSFAALAMGLNGILTALLMPILVLALK